MSAARSAEDPWMAVSQKASRESLQASVMPALAFDHNFTCSGKSPMMRSPAPCPGLGSIAPRTDMSCAGHAMALSQLLSTSQREYLIMSEDELASLIVRNGAELNGPSSWGLVRMLQMTHRAAYMVMHQ